MFSKRFQTVLKVFSEIGGEKKEPLILCTIEGYVYSLIKSGGFCVNARETNQRKNTDLYFLCMSDKKESKYDFLLPARSVFPLGVASLNPHHFHQAL